MINKILSAYIHVPFCKQKCYYCDFNSFSNKDNLIDEYFEMLKKEIQLTYTHLKSINANLNLSSVYIGGGTPSVVNEKYICELLNEIKSTFNLATESEVTIECNPESATLNKLKAYNKSGVNRVSIGLQSANNDILKKIGRVHTFEDFKKSFENAKNVGFKNINIDLMCGLIDQNINDFLFSIKQLIEMGATHFSIYSLTIEESTPMAEIYNRMEERFPDENFERRMYWGAKRLLEMNGYNHYEISNFAKKGYEGKHNIFCWEGNDYFGFGAGAHSYYNQSRFSNLSSIEEYIKSMKSAQCFNEIRRNDKIAITDKEKEKEYFLLGFRLLRGVCRVEFENLFNKKIDDYLPILNKLVKKNLVIKNGDYYSLSNKGLDFANEVFMEFV